MPASKECLKTAMQNNRSHVNTISLSVVILQSVQEFVRGGDIQLCRIVPFTKELGTPSKFLPW